MSKTDNGKVNAVLICIFILAADFVAFSFGAIPLWITLVIAVPVGLRALTLDREIDDESSREWSHAEKLAKRRKKYREKRAADTPPAEK